MQQLMSQQFELVPDSSVHSFSVVQSQGALLENNLGSLELEQQGKDTLVQCQRFLRDNQVDRPIHLLHSASTTTNEGVSAEERGQSEPLPVQPHKAATALPAGGGDQSKERGKKQEGTTHSICKLETL